MGRVALAALALGSLLTACGARTGAPLDDPPVSVLAPATTAGRAGAAGASAGAAAGKGGVGGGAPAHPCGDCVAKQGPLGCALQHAWCAGAPACEALSACLVNNGCLERFDAFACGKERCPSFITADVDWAPFAACAVCLPECQPACAVTQTVCAAPTPAPATACAHGLCQAGAPLDPSCDPCVAATCQARPQCCDPASSVGWNEDCATLADKACGACLE
ncbi:MAG: hypothetical protein IT374_18715 [Polyangiaceae bacterium]|nr:hypothetical protein [Polyangiaceae bacterium]